MTTATKTKTKPAATAKFKRGNAIPKLWKEHQEQQKKFGTRFFGMETVVEAYDLRAL